MKPSSKSIGHSVSIIGAGRLGTALALALSAKGYAIDAVVGRQIKGARRAAKIIGSAIRSLSFAHLQQLPNSRIIFITTPDDAIESVARRLADSINDAGHGRIVLHASGALSSNALVALRKVGFAIGSMHPLMSVSDPRTGAKSLGNAHFCIEGEPRAVRAARSMVRALGGKSFSIDTRDKALYHAAAVMSSGHMVALFDIATEMLMSCGLTDKQASASLLPLLTSTVDNLSHNPPARALTGTFARADIATVKKHLSSIRESGDHDALAAYTLLALRSLQLAHEGGASLSNVKKIKRLLKETK